MYAERYKQVWFRHKNDLFNIMERSSSFGNYPVPSSASGWVEGRGSLIKTDSILKQSANYSKL